MIDPQSKNGNVEYVGLEHIEQQSGVLVSKNLVEYSTIKSTKNQFNNGDILYGKLRPNLNKVWCANYKGICSTDFFVLRAIQSSVLPKYLHSYLLSERFNNRVMDGVGGAQLPRVSYNFFADILIPLPSIEEQEEVVKQIEVEREIVNANKQLIAIYEKRIQKRISQVWGEDE